MLNSFTRLTGATLQTSLMLSFFANSDPVFRLPAGPRLSFISTKLGDECKEPFILSKHQAIKMNPLGEEENKTIYLKVNSLRSFDFASSGTSGRCFCAAPWWTHPNYRRYLLTANLNFSSDVRP